MDDIVVEEIVSVISSSVRNEISQCFKSVIGSDSEAIQFYYAELGIASVVPSSQ